MRAALLLLAASGGLLAPACVSVHSEDRVWLSTDPPGASVYVNDVDTGFATPTWLHLGIGGTPRITLRLAGHREESFLVGDGAMWDGITPGAALSSRLLDAPIFYYLTAEDVRFPIRFRLRRTPARVHLKLLPL